MKLVNAACVTVAVMGSFVCLARGNHSAAFKDAQTKGADARVRLCGDGHKLALHYAVFRIL